jgi:branched-chain amino acid transport system substrate-binding protein
LAVAGVLASCLASPASAVPTKSTITIGVPLQLTGPSAESFKYSKAVAESWGKWVNASGGINGHPVKVVLADTGPDATKLVASVKDLVENQKVLALVAAYDPNLSTVQKYIQKQKIAVIGTGLGEDFWFNSPDFFAFRQPASLLDTRPAAVAKNVGVKKLGLVVCAESPRCGAADAPLRAAAAAAGIQFGGTIKATLTQPSYTAECLALKNSEVKFVYIVLNQLATFRLIQDCERQRVGIRYGVAGGAWNENIASFDAGRITAVTAGFPWYVEHPLVRQFRDVMKKYAGKAPWKADTGTLTWMSLELFRKAMAKAPNQPTRADVYTGMYSLKNENLGGLLPQKWTWTRGKPSPQGTCGFLQETVHTVFDNRLGGLTPFCPDK